MSETQGRGGYYDDGRIERAAKYAHENGGSDDDVEQAARREFGSAASDITDLIRQKMYDLFGR